MTDDASLVAALVDWALTKLLKPVAPMAHAAAEPPKNKRLERL